MENRDSQGRELVGLLEIEAGPNAVRIEDADETLHELAASIREVGLINAIGVEERDGQLVVVHGHRRYAACKMAGVAEIPIVRLQGERSDLMRMIFDENYHRKDPSPIEQAKAIAERLEAGDITEEQVAHTFNRSVQWVRDQVKILSWPMDVLEAVHTGQLNRAAGAALAQITDEAYRVFLVRNAVEGGASGRTCEAWLAGWRASVPPSEAIELEPEQNRPGAPAPTPMAPCLCCGEPSTYDRLSNVLVCVDCVRVIGQMVRRQSAAGG